MNIKTSKLSTIAIISLLFFTMTAGICSAQGWSRKGKNELFGTIQMIGSEEIKYSFTDKLPVKLDIDSAPIYGIGYGYNITDHWNVNTDLLFGSADTDVQTISGSGFITVETKDMDYVLWNVNLDYNIWKSCFTPLVTGGIGIMDFGIDTTATGVMKVHESNFSYNLGAGVRWEIEDNLLIKVMYRSTWTEFGDANQDLQYDSFCLNVAYMY
ncbi:MAG: porin family protein [Sedimentisphaerales bacterium]|nr:porin family protein [Sedimentisphaerales bacterium]